ncbi:DUF2271 domain-containing protein [Flavihumibacter sp. CACIAM 22H1]|uniref:DUF2271 domain-containing protein n=1 Tax=Flavihumibacter sp. CACIAM 22H1 TaxID=1812911 RepID=UPI0007A8A0E9|nr:DUF2271 domain-containing protein [Flavihumibacter sp. CACIAM 22H1]KYP14107.1 MAG: flagellin biosynthesis protein FlgD [Flavihumibacter sp. CACIAM 22H1]
MRAILLSLFALLILEGAIAQEARYKCLLQTTNYKGLEAYIVVSLINPAGQYEKTLYIMGPDKQWYNGFKEWNKQLSKKKENLSAITGASVAAGDRSSTSFVLDEAKLNKGYKLRFETAVEDQDYHVTDVEIPMTTEALTLKTEGKGYIRFVKLSKVQ